MIIVGIDLGTSNSSICYYKNNVPHIITDVDSCNISSRIGITKYGHIFGNQVKSIKDTNLFISNLKRLIGYKYSDLNKTYYDQYQFKITNDENDNIIININDEYLRVDELMSYFLNYLKTLIEKEIDEPYKVIVTVPAYFNINQKEAINNCINATGMNLLKLINEPTSAAIGYGTIINLTNTDDTNILIFDLGGGTLDLSVLNITKDSNETLYEVIATYGNNKFGGSDLTFLLIDFLKQKYSKKQCECVDNNRYRCKCNIVDFEFDNNNLFSYVDKLKINLSNGMEMDTIKINDKEIIMLKDEFDFIVSEWSETILESIDKVLEIADLEKNEINHVLFVGGTSKLKHVKNIVGEYFNCEKNKYYYLNDVETTNGIIKTIPMEDISVAYGAAYHGYILFSSKDLVLVDVCPFTIGIETIDGLMVPIIDCNSTIPISKTKQFTTDSDYMTEVKIKIYQGESKIVKHNIYLGEFTLSGIIKALKGVPVINVNITIDNSGLLKITASDRKNFTRNSIVISAKDYKMSDEETELIKNNMFKNKEIEDKMFNLINNYNMFLIEFDKLIYNLIINPVSNFNKEFIDDIRNNLSEKINEIYTVITNNEELNNLDFPINFDKFLSLANIFYSNNLQITQTKDYNNIFTYLTILFNNIKLILYDKYQNLLITLNNDTLNNQTYDKDAKSCDISNEGFSKIDDMIDKNDELLDNLMSTSITDITDNTIDNETAEYNLELYKFGQLLSNLLNNLNDIPIDINGKNLLVIKLAEKQDVINEIKPEMIIIDKINLIKLVVNDINNYCVELSTKYHIDIEEQDKVRIENIKILNNNINH
jgi:molecular chaperone DnaK (HSP70)